MFNVGIIAGRSASANPVRLTNRQIGTRRLGIDQDGDYVSEITLLNAGFLTYTVDGGEGGGVINASGEWLASGIYTPGVGSGYEARATVQASSIGVSGAGVWQLISQSRRYYNQTSSQSLRGFRILVEIRDATTKIILGSAVFWTPNFAP